MRAVPTPIWRMVSAPMFFKASAGRRLYQSAACVARLDPRHDRRELTRDELAELRVARGRPVHGAVREVVLVEEVARVDHREALGAHELVEDAVARGVGVRAPGEAPPGGLSPFII